MTDAPQDSVPHGDEYVINMDDVPGSKRFRFKQRPLKSRDRHIRSRSTHQSSSSRDGHRHYHHHHRQKRRKVSPTPIDDPSAYDDSINKMPPETAFRESLFDALGDDEGAAYWEGVYGQPIHTYPNTSVKRETGELERMNDEEYAQHVRRKMWEKSWEGIEAEKEERKRKRKEEEKQNLWGAGDRPKADFDKGRIFDFEVEESLRRGEQRRQRRRWRTRWNEYLETWLELQQRVGTLMQEPTDSEGRLLKNEIAWPVESGKIDDLTPDGVETFFRHGTENASPELDRETALLSALKVERVRWHPDKMQQKYGSFGLDEQTIKGITAVFQVIDRMWNDIKEQKV